MGANWSKELTVSGRKKTIQVIGGKITDQTEDYDLLICSAYKGRYSPYGGTLIGDLHTDKGITVSDEAANPEMDRKEKGNYWVSGILNGNFARIGCVELLSIENCSLKDYSMLKTIKESFSTVYEMLKGMDNNNMIFRKIIMPVLGSGTQGIEMCFLIPPLVKQTINILNDFPDVKEIVFCEEDEERAKELITALTKFNWEAEIGGNNPDSPEVFISYASEQKDLADIIRSQLKNLGVKCFMTPYSIPVGSNYESEVALALSKVSTILFILTEDAENSSWVKKEVASAIGAGCRAIPFRSKNFVINTQFGYMLNGIDIFDVDASLDEDEKCEKVTDYAASLCTKKNIFAAKTEEHKESTEEKAIESEASCDKEEVSNLNAEKYEDPECIKAVDKPDATCCVGKEDKTDNVCNKEEQVCEQIRENKCNCKLTKFVDEYKNLLMVGIGITIVLELFVLILKKPRK